jgi:hypothetical protein
MYPGFTSAVVGLPWRYSEERFKTTLARDGKQLTSVPSGEFSHQGVDNATERTFARISVEGRSRKRKFWNYVHRRVVQTHD